jgi:sortase (surface protein transpeptidase)
VTDVLPAGLTFVSAAPASGTYTAGTGVWNIGPLASGASTTLTLTATVTATGTLTNTALKSAETQADPNLANDAASVSIRGQPTSGLPGPPNGGMAPPIPNTIPSPSGGGQGGGLLLVAATAGYLGLLFLRRRSQRIVIATMLLAFALTGVSTSPSGGWQGGGHLTPAQLADVERFGKSISTVKPVIGVRTVTLHPATGPVTPYRLRIPALDIDTLIEPVGVTARGLMDVPANIWDAAWLRSGVKPGAPGQAVIDGHLDSVAGSAVFGDLNRLHPGDRIFVSDESGGEVSFRVTALRVEPLDGFPTLRVFGPAQGRFLNLITCAGHYDPARRTYNQRLVVFAELM